MAERYISLKPSDATHGGAMVPEGEYEISDAKFIDWDYNGTRPAVPVLGVEFKDKNQDYTQYYSAGDARNLEPSEDKRRLKPRGTATGLNDQTNCYAFLKSLVNAGFSEDKLTDDIGVIIGAQVEVVHEPTPERQIGDRKVEKKLIPVIRKVISLPGEKDKKKPEKPAAAKKSNGSETAMTEDRLKKATQVIISVLKSNHGSLEKKAMSTAIFKTMPASDPDRGDFLNLLVNDQFLKDLCNDGVIYNPANGYLEYVGD